MDALSMMKTAAVLLGIAAIGGLVMAVIRFRGADRPPTIVLMAHGLLAAAALTLLLYACFTVGLPSLAMAATGIFVVVAIVGAALNLKYHSRMLPLPKTPVVIHGLVGLFGAIMAYNGALLAISVMDYKIPTLGIPEGFNHVPVAIAGALILLFSIEHIVAILHGTEVEPAWH